MIRRFIIGLFLLSATSEMSAAGDMDVNQAVVGTIVSYECGDNCYLTIASSDHTKLTGLCTADVCAPWNEAVEMPAEFVGRSILVSLGVGTQFDGSGNEVGPFIAFSAIAFE